MTMYQGPELPPLTVGVEDPTAPHVQSAESITGLGAAMDERLAVTVSNHTHRLGEVSDFGLLELMLWTQVLGG